MSKVLLIDDDIELVGMFQEYLEQEGFEVKTANDGVAGTACALTGEYAMPFHDSLSVGAIAFTGFTFNAGAQHTASIGNDLSIITSAGAQLFRNDDAQVQYTATNVRDGARPAGGAEVPSCATRSFSSFFWLRDSFVCPFFSR